MEKPTLDQVIEMFQNGEQRYAEDNYFKEAIDSLTAGLGVYAVLDALLKKQSGLIAMKQAYADFNIELSKANSALRDDTEFMRTSLIDYREENQKLKDQVASLKEALQHYQR